jgi:hypothetical protein
VTYNRRDFLKFLGSSAAIATSGISVFNSCALSSDFNGLASNHSDELILKNGLDYQVLISWGEKLKNNDFFGFNNDFIAFHSLNKNKDEALLWVNHEYPSSLFLTGEVRNHKNATKENVTKERKALGGSILKIRKNKNNQWQFVANDPMNRRLDGFTKIPFSSGYSIKGQKYAEGTFGNCAGGYTPWNTVLTCEENYQMYYGERLTDGSIEQSYNLWEKAFPENLPEHYGWVVEVHPETGKSEKLISLGRFAHESATVYPMKDGRVAVYSGDDKRFEHLYKFVSSKPGSLREGVLYAADLSQGKWLALDLKLNKKLRDSGEFKTQLDVLINTRKAAKILGATPLDRPEDIDIHPQTGEVYVALTKNKENKNYHGSILKVSPFQNDHASESFESDTFLFGGPKTGVSCPDNITFDRKGNLWVATDRSGDSINQGPYKGMGNNGIFVVPVVGKSAGKIIQVASAPMDAEFSGLCFDPEHKNLFASVQHPGEMTTDLSKPTSSWPEGKGKTPKPSVIAINGEFLDRIVS